MGSVVKHVTGALTGHSGGSKTTTKEKSNSNSSQESWLEKNPQYQGLQNNALNEAQHFNMPTYQLAGSNTNLNQGLAGLAKGINTSGYYNAANQMENQGNQLYGQGNTNLNTAYGNYQNLSNLSQTDMQNMLKNEYDSDLVNAEIKGASRDINEQYQDQVSALNQQANIAGGMGNSRAGVAQGVMAGKAQAAIGNASVNFRSQEENAASQRINNYLGMQQNVAGSMAGIGQNQMSMGNQMYGAGMGYYNQGNMATTQNYQNQFTAGQFQQSQAQQALDIARQNQMMAQSPALARLSYYNQTLLPMAGLSGTGTNTSSGTSTAQSPGQGANLLGGFMGTGMSALGSKMGMGDQGSSMIGAFGSMFGNSYGS